ncbi:DUF4350 domain-containing protein [Sphingobacterium oryzagri]|uniref:DUF4350 domain-containing protein n=1 Tax=Sphingobacterium oryzagri TaxID=3025669 RepID=A0ABY7WJ12_9SPHI|nr:DUF4350 domain-containing protein [Sphingobacterium sp. KACC 22765]WDF68547.1 DUF4350 domain-containing protein [Sphingobacterium sp. KACC 22765]
MKNSGKLGIMLLAITLLVIAVIDISSDKQVDWTRSYDQRDKIPFGLYFTHTELPKILGDSTQVADFSSTNYSDIKKFLSGKEQATVLYIVNEFYEGKETIAELVAFVDRGGEVFISANSFPHELLDTLGLDMEYYYPQNFGEVWDVNDRPFALSNGTEAYYKDLEYPGFFYGLNAPETKKIGYFQTNEREMPNFLEIKRKNGRFLIHLEPLMFTNYYMLKQPNFLYAAAALRLISRKQVYWFDALLQDQNATRTPLRVLLQNAGLREAWYILLFGLLLFLLFRSKREQRAVPVIEPEPNLSKEFAKTIATLYYENGNPGNLVEKKIEYFLYELRTYYLIDILTLEEDGFAKHLSAKTGVALADCAALVALIIRYKNIRSSTDAELLTVNKQIEDFKNKANML